MKHNKKEHIEKVSVCWNHAIGACDFGNLNCWYSHTGKSQKDLSTPLQCKECNKMFNFAGIFKTQETKSPKFSPNL